MKSIIVPAIIEQLDTVTTFIEEQLEAQGCSLKVQMQVTLAVEEIFVNIAHYAYHPDIGEAVILCEIGGMPLNVTLQFQDEGQPYNPLEKGEPDITLRVEDREIGGLGIFLVKKSMDDVEYRYEDGKNILVIRKQL